MNKDDLKSLGILIRNALMRIPPPTGRKSLTKAIYETLKSHKAIRAALQQEFEGPIKCRYAGCPPVVKSGKKPRKVLGYLWDFSFTRFEIPQAIEQDGTVSGPNRYEILLVVESELGTSHEICRDLLKLLEARAAIRCLIYKQPTEQHRQRLHSRFIRVLHNHAHFNPRCEQWLFVGLSWVPGHIQGDAYTLAADGSRLIPVGT